MLTFLTEWHNERIIEKFQRVKNVEVLKKVLNFRNGSILSKYNYCVYINNDYIMQNNLVLRPAFKHVHGEFEFGNFYDLLRKNNINSFYILLIDKIKKINPNKFEHSINISDDIDIYFIDNISREDFINLLYEIQSTNFILFNSLSFDFFILSTYFYYDLICGKKEIVDNFVKMTNKQVIKKLKEIDEDIEDPIRLYDIYGKYFEDLDKK